MRRGRGIVALGAALWAWLIRGRWAPCGGRRTWPGTWPDQMNGWLLAATRRVRRDEEARIARELRESYSENFARMVQLCRSLLGEDEVEAGEVLAAMFHTVIILRSQKAAFRPGGRVVPTPCRGTGRPRAAANPPLRRNDVGDRGGPGPRPSLV